MDPALSFPPTHMQFPPTMNQTFYSPDSFNGGSTSYNLFHSTSGNNNGGIQHSTAARVGHANTASCSKPETPKQDCSFRMRTVDECYQSRLYASALEYYLLAKPTFTPGNVCCLMSRCQRPFPDPEAMLWHLRDCAYFPEGRYECPECKTTEKFRTTSKKQCSWRRPRLSSKAMKFLQASAAVIRRLTSTKSKLCPNCRHIVQHDLNQELASCGSPRSVHEFDASSSYAGEKHSNAYSECGKSSSVHPWPSSSSFSSWASSRELVHHELPDAPLVELVGHEATTELHGQSIHRVEVNSAMAGVRNSSNLPPALSSGSGSSPSEPSCTSAFSDGSYSSNVSPSSSVKSATALGDTNGAQYTNIDSFFTMSSQQSTAGVEQSSTNLESHVYKQPTQIAPGVGIPGLAVADMEFQDPFGGSTAANAPRGNMRAGRQTPPLSLHIPFTWGPDFADVSLEQILGYGDASATATTTAAPATPSLQSFRNSLARSSTNPSPRATSSANTQTHIIFPEDVSPSTSAGGNGSSPSTGGKPTPSSSEFECPDCGFTPSGIPEKAATYFYKHRMTHRKERHHCPKCNKSYSRKDNVTAHAKKRHGESLGALFPGVGRKRLGSGDSDQISLQRKKSRSHDDASAALAATSEWGSMQSM
ncbi:hypothetical protein PG997_015295 [Apiospora hydei]|uniref:C2H2-type domain-containing protein n=1 Tax=Apiospora hydei TaxID=1337664 RepID=A0ABR1UQ83_9PEZI